MRILSSKVVEQAIEPHVWIETMEQALKESATSLCDAHDKLQLNVNNNTMLLSSTVASEYFVNKTVTVSPKSATEGKLSTNATYTLHDSSNGEALAVINGEKMSALQKAAVACVGMRHLADPLATTIGIIGGGIKGRHVAWLACCEREIERIYVYDSSPRVIAEFIHFMSEKCPFTDVALCEDAQQVVVNSEIVVTATNSEEPVIPNLEDLIIGKCFVCVGSNMPNMRELPDSVFRLIDSVWVDVKYDSFESGDLLHPLEQELIKPEQVKHIGNLISSANELGFRETRLFKILDNGLFDIIGSKIVYQSACENDLGVDVEL